MIVPFTLAHAAAGLPLRRFNLVWSAFVIGTFAPDFEYFLRLSPRSRYGHEFPGVFTFTVPAALLVLCLFHGFMKRPLSGLLPDSLRRRLNPQIMGFQIESFRKSVIILFSTCLGIATHLLWDFLTHTRWLYLLWPAVKPSIKIPAVGTLTDFELVDFVCSIVGLLALGIWFARWYRRSSPTPESRTPSLTFACKVAILSGMTVVASVGACFRTFDALGTDAVSYTPSEALEYFVIASIG